MSTFVIHTHGRLQEWVAQEHGYYAAEGLEDYVLRPNDLGFDRHAPPPAERGLEYGAYESYEKGREATVSCACHWTVNIAASAEHGMLWGEAYSVCPGGIMVPPESPIRTPADLAGVRVHVGYHSGSHYTTIQALEAILPADRIALHFGGGPDERLGNLIDRRSEAGTVFGLQLYVLEQLGFRKIVDTTFMMGFLLSPQADLEDTDRYFRALRRAQQEIDLEPEPYKHYYARELPSDLAAQVDVRRFGPGERIVFEPYTREIYERTQRWMQTWDLLSVEDAAQSRFETAVLV
jgi:hypothetical protein